MGCEYSILNAKFFDDCVAGISVVESRAVVDVSNLTELIPFVVQDLDCSGNESSLRDCEFSTNINSSCSDQFSTASVQCTIQGKVMFSA